jgi:hypothetical protein
VRDKIELKLTACKRWSTPNRTLFPVYHAHGNQNRFCSLSVVSNSPSNTETVTINEKSQQNTCSKIVDKELNGDVVFSLRRSYSDRSDASVLFNRCEIVISSLTVEERQNISLEIQRKIMDMLWNGDITSSRRHHLATVSNFTESIT